MKFNPSKCTILMVASLFIFSKSFSQKEASNRTEFKRFKVDFSSGFSLPTGQANPGFVITLEPKYALMRSLDVGLRLEREIAVFKGFSPDLFFFGNDIINKSELSYLATADYYFNIGKKRFKPFIGGGAGVFHAYTAKANSFRSHSNNFGGMTRSGFEFKHLRFGVEYNIVGKTIIDPSSSFDNRGYEIANSYIGIKLGVLIGGGKR